MSAALVADVAAAVKRHAHILLNGGVIIPSVSAWPRCSFSWPALEACVCDLIGARGHVPRQLRLQIRNSVTAGMRRGHCFKIDQLMFVLQAVGFPVLSGSTWGLIDEKVYRHLFDELRAERGLETRRPASAAEDSTATAIPAVVPQVVPQDSPSGPRGGSRMSVGNAAARRHYRMMRYWQAQVKRLREMVKQLRPDIAELKNPFHKNPKRAAGQSDGKKHCRVSVQGGYTLALRRNLGHAGASLILGALDLNWTRFLINNWERTLAANLMVQSRVWHKRHYDYLEALAFHMQGKSIDDNGCAQHFSAVIVSVSGDATNSSAVQSSKAHSVECKTTFLHTEIEGFDVDDDCPPRPDTNTQGKLYAFLQRVPQHCGSYEARAMYRKQMADMGVRLWSNDDYSTKYDAQARGLNNKPFLNCFLLCGNLVC